MNELETTQRDLPAQPAAFDLRAAIETGKQQVIQTQFKDIPVFIVPNYMKVETLEKLVDEQLPRPYSLEQATELFTEQSFIEYFNRYATESSTIFIDDKNSVFTAVLDFHDDPINPAWKRHIAIYKCPRTQDWLDWVASNEKKMSQEDFALFIEDHPKQFHEPDAAHMMQVATTLKATNNVDYKSSIRLENGDVQFNYSETVNGNAGINGTLEIPEKIKLVIAPFTKGSPYEVGAYFRYRIVQSKLSVWYKLISHHLILDDAFTEVTERIKAAIPIGHIVFGRHQ